MNQAQRHLLSEVEYVLHIPRICKAGSVIVIFKQFTLRMVSRTRQLQWESLDNRVPYSNKVFLEMLTEKALWRVIIKLGTPYLLQIENYYVDD